jgi:Fe-coproporphyrin III synthase
LSHGASLCEALAATFLQNPCPLALALKSPFTQRYNLAVEFRYLQYARGIFRPVDLESLFLFVTSSCNSLCRTCFYWEELNQGRDLTFEQLEKISATAPQFHKLWLSGGEPFLRKDLAEVIELFYRNNAVRAINLPTNGLLPKQLEQVIDALLERCPDLVIDLNFSLDGLANTHDTIRGVPHNFAKTLATMELAAARWRDVHRLRRNVATCITSENYRELLQLGLSLMRAGDLDGQYFEIVRGGPMDPSLKQVPRQELAALHRQLMWLHEKYADRLFASLASPARQLAKAYYLGNLKLHFDLHERNHYGPSRWPMRCTAGLSTIVVDHDGHFRACEMRGKLGRLQDFDFDLGAALRSTAMRQETAAIPQANCWCTHSCWIHSSSKFSPRAQLFHIPWAYLKHRWERLPHIEVSELEKFLVHDAPQISPAAAD